MRTLMFMLLSRAGWSTSLPLSPRTSWRDGLRIISTAPWTGWYRTESLYSTLRGWVWLWMDSVKLLEQLASPSLHVPWWEGLEGIYQLHQEQHLLKKWVQAIVVTHNIAVVYLQVFAWTHEVPPDPKRILDTYFDSDQNRLATYQLQVRLVDSCVC